jgi:hypothetical protein
VPKELDQALSRALAKPLDARLQSAVALAAELRSFGAVLDVRAGESGPSELIPLDDDGGGAARWLTLTIVLGGLALAVWYWLR